MRPTPTSLIRTLLRRLQLAQTFNSGGRRLVALVGDRVELTGLHPRRCSHATWLGARRGAMGHGHCRFLAMASLCLAQGLRFAVAVRQTGRVQRRRD